jgi:putative ABC transport system permease protein
MAVTLGVAVAIALARVALEVGDDFARTLRAAGPNFVLLPKGARWPVDVGGADFHPVRAGVGLNARIVPDLKQSFWKNNILAASPELAVAAVIDGAPIPLVGTWFDHEVATVEGTWRTGLASLRPHWKLTGRWPAEEAAELVVSEEWGAQHRVGVGDRVIVSIG